MVRQPLILIVAACFALPLQAQQDSALIGALRPVVHGRGEIRVLRYDNQFIVDRPARWLDTLHTTRDIRATVWPMTTKPRK